MAQEYLPAPSNVRLADLMKEHNISQPELAKEIGCSKSTISRFISGAKGTLTHEQVLKIARLFNVSTDFLLGETNIPDRKNYDIAELGLSVEAAKNLYTGRVNTEVVNLLLENARFAELTYRISQYFDDTFASGIAAQNAMLTILSTLLRTRVKTPEAAKAAKDISLRRKPVYQHLCLLVRCRTPEPPKQGNPLCALSSGSGGRNAEPLVAAAPGLESAAPAFLQHPRSADPLSGPSACWRISPAGSSHSLGAGFSVRNRNADLFPESDAENKLFLSQ